MTEYKIIKYLLKLPHCQLNHPLWTKMHMMVCLRQKESTQNLVILALMAPIASPSCFVTTPMKTKEQEEEEVLE